MNQLKLLGLKHLKLARIQKLNQISGQEKELNLMNIGGFDDLEEYIYIPTEIAKN